MRSHQSEKVRLFFNDEYVGADRYWWKGENRYDVNPQSHTPMNAALLKLLDGFGGGRVLDLGAGEGADSIRLAKMGFSVTAIELSEIGAEKIKRFSAEAGVMIRVVNGDITRSMESGDFDVILCQGVLHYVEDKPKLLAEIKLHTKPGGLNAISCFTDVTPVPSYHKRVPVFPDREEGDIANAYSTWTIEFKLLERGVSEHSHLTFEPHLHSFIKLIARKPI
jgi:tellurite methyltransferase